MVLYTYIKKITKHPLLSFLLFSITLSSLCLISSSNSSAATGGNYIFVGDSRIVGMEEALSDNQKENCYFVSKNAIGHAWMVKTAIPAVQKIINANPNITFNIIFTLGVNDLSKSSTYVKTYNNIIEKKFSKHNLYVVSVNPIIEETLLEYGFKSRTDASIIKFNKTIKNKISSTFTYIDTYTELTEIIGFGTIDGLHFCQFTYKNIFSLILDAILGIDSPV